MQPRWPIPPEEGSRTQESAPVDSASSETSGMSPQFASAGLASKIRFSDLAADWAFFPAKALNEGGLSEKIVGTEVALNMISGTGKEHMALLSAVLKSGLGVRIVANTVEGMKEL